MHDAMNMPGHNVIMVMSQLHGVTETSAFCLTELVLKCFRRGEVVFRATIASAAERNHGGRSRVPSLSAWDGEVCEIIIHTICVRNSTYECSKMFEQRRDACLGRET